MQKTFWITVDPYFDTSLESIKCGSEIHGVVFLEKLTVPQLSRNSPSLRTQRFTTVFTKTN
jgi:hypothetical protein